MGPFMPRQKLIEMDTPFDMLHKVGFSLRCCDLCSHSRFYQEGSPWGLCTNYKYQGEPLKTHKLGRCRRGFKPEGSTISTRGLSAYLEFMGKVR